MTDSKFVQEQTRCEMQSQDFGCRYADSFGIKSLFVVSMMGGLMGTLQVWMV